MNIIICGAGEVGRHLAEVMSPAGHNITIIERDADRLDAMRELLDARVMQGDGTHAEDLNEAGVGRADLFVAVTQIDEVNLLSASVAKSIGCAKCIARVNHSAFYERRGLDYARHLGIDHLVSPVFSTAQAIAATLRSPGALAVESFARGKIEMQRLPVSDDAKGIGQHLRDLKLPGSTRIAAVEHNGGAEVPNAETVIQAGDVVTILGDPEHFAKATRLFDTGAGKRKKVMIMGGSPLAVWLCRAIRHRNFSVRLFEMNPKRAAELAEKLDWVTVLADDPMTSDALQEERVDQADAFIALTSDDENNLLAAARAKSMGVASAIAVQQRGTYLHLLEHIGIDRAFSPRATAVSEIQRLLQPGPVRQLASLASGIADIYEVRVPRRGSKVVDRPLREIEMPPHCLIAAVQRDGDFFIPGAGDAILAGDTVVVIAPQERKKELAKLFAG